MFSGGWNIQDFFIVIRNSGLRALSMDWGSCSPTKSQIFKIWLLLIHRVRCSISYGSSTGVFWWEVGTPCCSLETSYCQEIFLDSSLVNRILHTEQQTTQNNKTLSKKNKSKFYVIIIWKHKKLSGQPVKNLLTNIEVHFFRNELNYTTSDASKLWFLSALYSSFKTRGIGEKTQ